MGRGNSVFGLGENKGSLNRSLREKGKTLGGAIPVHAILLHRWTEADGVLVESATGGSETTIRLSSYDFWRPPFLFNGYPELETFILKLFLKAHE